MADVANKAYEGTYFGEPAVYLEAGGYEAIALPGVGGNLIAFRDVAAGYRFLREPQEQEMASFKQTPYVHGIPVLYPPNRYRDGKFPWQGATYTFPINEARTGNHLHGFVHNVPWEVEQLSADSAESRVTLKLQVREGDEVHRHFPQLFTLRIQYSLSAAGLRQRVTLHNDSDLPLPCTIGFHTTVNAPFAAGSSPEDYSFRMTTGERWALDERMLPTGQFQPLTDEEQQMKAGGLSPFFAPMDNHYTAVPQDGRNRMELTDAKAGVKLVYDVGTAYKQWMIWNNEATPGYFCPEPQVNVVNAPDVGLPHDEVGLFALEPGAVWEETSRLYAIKL